MVYLADVQEASVRWLWYPYILSGKVSIIMGDPGTGKTTLSSAITAIVTTGSAFPQNQDYQRLIYRELDNLPSAVILQNAEDGYSDTIKPRFFSAGANISNFFSLNYQRLTTAITIMVFAITLLTQMLLAFERKAFDA